MGAEKNYRLTERFKTEEEFEEGKNVIKAFDTVKGCFVAVKRWERKSMRGINEIAQRSKLSSKNIDPFICSFEDGTYRYMVCKYSEGENLKEYVTKNGPFEENEALTVFYEICDALVYLCGHESGAMIYNDLKPENVIFYKADGFEEKISVKLVDFETCRPALKDRGDYSETFETLPLGSYFFTAPEVFTGKETVFSDVYSAGAVLGFMLFGMEFCEKTEECLKKCSTKTGKIIKECMAKNEAFKRISPQRLREKTGKYIETGEYEEEIQPEYEEIREVRETVKKSKRSRKKDKFIVTGKLSICVDDNLCFATELAYSCAETFKMKTLLIDSYTLKNRVTAYMLADMVRERDENPYGLYSLETCLFSDENVWYDNGFIGKVEGNECLEIGTMRLQEEICSVLGKMEAFYNWAYRHYDAIILNLYGRTAENVRDEVLKLFNYVIIASNPNVDEIESQCEQYTKLSKQGKVYCKNVKYVAWDYVENQSLPEKGIECITGEDRYLGAVSYNNARYRLRNKGEKPEFYGLNGDTKEEYTQILTKIIFGGE